MKNAIIYGRRRVGKSELITHALLKSNVNFLYYECKQTTKKNNIDSLYKLLQEKYNLPNIIFDDFESLINYIISLNKEIILVLDEYPYLRDVIVGLDSIIQSIIDNKKIVKLKIILCGSNVDVMKSLLDDDNPLYGRFDFKLELLPMNYIESSYFYPNFSNSDKVKIYSVFGGIPYYNSLVDDSLTVKENIIKLIASPNAHLEGEILGYLKSQL